MDNKLEIPTPFTGRKGGKRTKEGYKGDKYLHEYDENKEKFLLKIWIFELFKEKNRKDKYENLLSHKKDKFIFYSFSLPKTFWTITNKEREKTKEG